MMREPRKETRPSTEKGIVSRRNPIRNPTYRRATPAAMATRRRAACALHPTPSPRRVRGESEPLLLLVLADPIRIRQPRSYPNMAACCPQTRRRHFPLGCNYHGPRSFWSIIARALVFLQVIKRGRLWYAGDSLIQAARIGAS